MSIFGSWFRLLAAARFMLAGSGGLLLTGRTIATPTPRGVFRQSTAATRMQSAERTTPTEDSTTQPQQQHPDDRRTSILTIISEDVWRSVAKDHRGTIRSLLQPGLVDADHPMMRSVRKHFVDDDQDANEESRSMLPQMTMLDPKHPIYNFLVEYYGLKGLKGPKRLARWSPSIGLFFWDEQKDHNDNFGNNGSNSPSSRIRRIDNIQEYHRASIAYCDDSQTMQNAQTAYNSRMGRDQTDRGIFLEGASPDDFALTLYLQGAEWVDGNGDASFGGKSGIMYRPIRHFEFRNHADAGADAPATAAGDVSDRETKHRKATSFSWYRSILEQTLSNDAILHCYGLHEWAMQYHPEGAPPPPSGKYQAHLPLRVPRQIINDTVERKGLRCTHVDALRFFAPAAGPLNHHGASLERSDQLALEQPGCVHAHMDLLKIALRVRPYCDPALLVKVLEVALEARSLDVGASPYDCSEYACDTEGSPIRIIPVETPEGRALYKSLQSELMDKATHVREQLLDNYRAFGFLVFSKEQLQNAIRDPTDERFAKAEPGGKAWRQNLIDRPSVVVETP